MLCVTWYHVYDFAVENSLKCLLFFTQFLGGLYTIWRRVYVHFCLFVVLCKCMESLWSPYYKKDKQLLEKVQRRFKKMIVNIDGMSYEDRLWSLKLWSLEERRNRQDLIEVFKMSKGMTRTRLQELFTLEENNKITRGHSLKLAKLRYSRDCWKHFFQTG